MFLHIAFSQASLVNPQKDTVVEAMKPPDVFLSVYVFMHSSGCFSQVSDGKTEVFYLCQENSSVSCNNL